MPVYLGERKCTKCKQIKPVGCFSAAMGGYISSWCKPCRTIYSAKCRSNRLEESRALAREYGKKQRELYPETVKAKALKWYHDNQSRAWEHRRKTKFGLAFGEFDRMLEVQNHQCLVCEIPFDDKDKPHIDHDHETGIVRGLLCRQCNWGIGHFKDNPFILRRALAYITKWNKLRK